MRNELAKTLIHTAREAGAYDLYVVRGGKRPRLVGRVGGQTFKYILPTSPSDWRTEKNCISGLRRLIRTRLEVVA